MQDSCYKIPPSFGALTKRQRVEKLPVLESIEQNIELYLSTRPGEHQYDPDYGCILHNFNFEQINSLPKRDELKRSVEDYLNRFDPRVAVDSVTVAVEDIVEGRQEGKYKTGSRRIRILIRCRLRQTNETLPEMKFELVRYS